MHVEFPHLLHIMLHHDPHEFLETCLLRIPAELCAGLRWITEQLVHLCRTEILRVHLNENLSN